jgi:hypothetical protein
MAMASATRFLYGAKGGGGNVDGAEVLAGDEWAVDDVFEGFGFEGDPAVLGFVDMQGGGVTPIVGEAEAEVDGDLVAAGDIGIDEASVPIDDAEEGAAVTVDADGIDGGLIADVVEVDDDSVGSGRDGAPEAIPFFFVAAPVEPGAAGEFESQAGHVFDGAFGAVDAGDPLGIPEGVRAGFCWHLDAGVKEAAGEFAGVDVDVERLGGWRLCGACGGDDEDGGEGNRLRR